ncbi:hypothetical protein IT396_00720 [Candidatus Nomurabacteria bacterium]|nr:hypothetical protein [Candidatus Nomurabacteria bacterium]
MATKNKKQIVNEEWRQLSKEQKIDAVRQAMFEGHTNVTAAQKLGTTPGAIAGIRFKNNIPSRGNIRVEEKPAPAPRVPTSLRPKLAINEATQCIWVDPSDGMRCAYEQLPGSRHCAQHQ